MNTRAPDRWVARPVEVEAVIWTGDFDALPPAWQAHPFIQYDGNLRITTIEGFVGTPVAGDYLVWGTASELYWCPPDIFEARWKPLGYGNRWVALPVETEAAEWTGHFDDLPAHWQGDIHLGQDAAGLWLVTHRGVVSRPRVGDFLVPRSTTAWSWVPRSIFLFKYERVTAG